MYVWAPNRVQTTRTAKPHRPQPEPASGGLTWAFSCQSRHVFVMKVRPAREGDRSVTAPARLLRRGVIGPMNASTPPSPHVAAPGTERPRRFRPKLRYELIGGGLRWYRCLRCDSWLALTPPEHPARKYPPARDEIMLPLRGKPLRDRYILRLI